MKLSVGLIAFNEEKDLPRTLEAIKDIADEIVVVDSFSTDNTVKIAESFGAKVFIEEWKGYVRQENSMLDKCSGEWILIIDCDEEVTPELKASILQAIDSGKYNGYTLNRRSFYLGKLMKYAWRPDRKIRLIKNSTGARYTGQDPHLILLMDEATGQLKGDLIHYSYDDFDQHMIQTLNHSRTWAKSKMQSGKRVTMLGLLCRPMFAFFKALILKGAILDGSRGVIAAMSSAMASYTKYSYLWEMQYNANKKKS